MSRIKKRHAPPRIKDENTPWARMPEKMKIMCEHYIETGNKGEAMREAGYAQTTIDKKMFLYFNRSDVVAYCAYLRERRLNNTQVDGVRILEEIYEMVQEAKATGNITAALRGLEMLGKHHALFTDKTVSEVEIKNPFATGKDDDSIERDIERLTMVAAPKLKVVGGKDSSD